MNSEEDRALAEMIGNIQEVLITYMMFVTDKYNNILVEDFRDIVNARSKEVFDLIVYDKVPMKDAIDVILLEQGITRDGC